MGRSTWLCEFPLHYPATLAGLVAAEAELVCLTALHAAYAEQPDVTPIWQGYIDQKQRAVERQRLTVETLRQAGLDPQVWLQKRPHHPRSRTAAGFHAARFRRALGRS